MKTILRSEGTKHARYRHDQQFKRDCEKGKSNEICILRIVKGTSAEAGNAKEEHDLIFADNAVINASLRQVSSAAPRASRVHTHAGREARESSNRYRRRL